MRLGLALPHYDTSFAGRPVSWDQVRDAAVTAERAGFESLWVSDHLFLDWGKYGGPDDPQGSLECWTTLSALAASTERVRLGSLTICNDLRNPALLAKMAASLDLLSDGRVDLGMGAGWYEPEYRAAGITFDGAGTRIRRLREAATIAGRLLAGEDVTFHGDHYRVDGAVVRPRPKQQPRPPIWVGGKGDFLLKVVAEVADGWNFSWLGDIETYKERSAVADTACEKKDRDPKSLARSVGVYLLAGKDDADAKRRYERLVERSPAGVLKQGSNGGPAVSWDEFRHQNFAGTVTEVTERLGELAEMGVQEVILTLGAVPFQLSDIEDIELVGTEIAPALR